MNFTCSSLILKRLNGNFITAAAYSNTRHLSFNKLHFSELLTNAFYINPSKISFELKKSKFTKSLDSVIVVSSTEYFNKTFYSHTEFSKAAENFSVSECIFTKCTSSNGGAMYILCSSFQCTSSLFSECTSSSSYGAMYISFYNSSSISTCCFDSCAASTNYNVFLLYNMTSNDLTTKVSDTVFCNTHTNEPYLIGMRGHETIIERSNSTNNDIGQNHGGFVYFFRCSITAIEYSAIHNLKCISFVYSHSDVEKGNIKSLSIDHCDILNNTFYYCPIMVEAELPHPSILKFTRFIGNQMQKTQVIEEGRIRLTIAQSFFDCDPLIFFNYTNSDKPTLITNSSYPLDPLSPIQSHICHLHFIEPTKEIPDDNNSALIAEIVIGSFAGLIALIIIGIVIVTILKKKKKKEEEEWFKRQTAEIADPIQPEI